MSNVESVVGGLVGFVRKDRLRGINLVDDEAQLIFVRCKSNKSIMQATERSKITFCNNSQTSPCKQERFLCAFESLMGKI